MKVQVVTRVVHIEGNPMACQPKSIDWSDSSDRKWLMNHMHHAMLNGKSVTLNPDSN